MYVNRKVEYFPEIVKHKEINNSIFQCPPNLYIQERDWTCSVAMLRSLLSIVGKEKTEDDYIKLYNITMGPHFSKEIAEWVNDKNLDIVCGYNHLDFDLSDILELFENGYFLALMFDNHWVVLIGYAKLGDCEENRFFYFCPYYNEVTSIRESDLECYWEGNKGKIDFFGIKKIV